MVAELLEKYIWIIGKLVSAGEGGLTMEEIIREWESRFGSPYSRRSFNNHRKAVEEIFGIAVECNRSTNRYYVSNAESITDPNSEKARLIDIFNVNSTLAGAGRRLSGRISPEPRPSGHIFLTVVLDAMTENRIVRIRYRRYGADNVSEYEVRPFGLKEYSQRWYLVGYCEEKASARVYSLDRIVGMDIVDRCFSIPRDFDIDALFSTSFGPYLSDRKGCLITFRTYGKETAYIRDLPVHHTQKEISSDENQSTFTIFASPDESMYLEFLRHGPNLEIISPDEVRDRMREILSIMNERYEK